MFGRDSSGSSRAGMSVFTGIWSGQLVALVGSGLTSFVLGIWVYQRTGSVTQYSLVLLASSLPGILVFPVAGPLIDRWDRRRIMALGNTVSAAIKLTVAWRLASNALDLPEILIAMGASSAIAAVQRLSYTASLSLMVEKRQLGRASGMVELAQAAAQMLAPLLAGVLVGVLSLQQAVLIDVAANLFAVVTLVMVRLPRPPLTGTGDPVAPTLLRGAVEGWRFIARRPGLLALLGVIAIVNFISAASQALLIPLVLHFSSTTVLSAVSSAGGAGMIIGSLIMSAWGGPLRRVRLVLWLAAVRGLSLVLAASILSPLAIACMLFCLYAGMPISNACSQVIWQHKTPVDMQGRVFAIRLMIASSASPLAYIVAGPLADRVFEPLVAVNGPLAGPVGRIIGVGPGHGLALFFMLLGIGLIGAAVAGALYPRLWRLEDELPDCVPDRAGAVA